jgi:hypothetical protein
VEVAIRKRQFNQWISTTVLLVICLMLFVPSVIAFASALNQPTIGMTGVNNSQLMLGMHATDDSTRLIDSSGHPSSLNPSSPAFQLGSMLPLIFIVLAILLILKMLDEGKLNIKVLILIGILIYLALAFLPNIQQAITNLLGG